MKNENDAIRESQTQPSNNYQCEHKEHRPAGSQPVTHREGNPQTLARVFPEEDSNQLNLFYCCPLWYSRHSEWSRSVVHTVPVPL